MERRYSQDGEVSHSEDIQIGVFGKVNHCLASLHMFIKYKTPKNLKVQTEVDWSALLLVTIPSIWKYETSTP